MRGVYGIDKKMACVDVDLCDKIDGLQNAINHTNELLGDYNDPDSPFLADIRTTIAEQTSTQIGQADVQIQGLSLIIGFLSIFLFFIIIRFLYNFFKSIL